MWGANSVPPSAPLSSYATGPTAQGPPLPSPYHHPHLASGSYSSHQIIGYSHAVPPQYRYPSQPLHASAALPYATQPSSYVVPSASASASWTHSAGGVLSHSAQQPSRSMLVPPLQQQPQYPTTTAPSAASTWTYGVTTTASAPQQPPCTTTKKLPHGKPPSAVNGGSSSAPSSARAAAPQAPLPSQQANQVRVSMVLASVVTDPTSHKTYSLATMEDNPNAVILIHQDNLRIKQPLRPQMVVNFVKAPDPTDPTRYTAKDVVVESIKPKRQATTTAPRPKVAGNPATVAATAPPVPSTSVPERSVEAAPLQKRRVEGSNCTVNSAAASTDADGLPPPAPSPSPAQQWSVFLERKQNHDIIVGSWFHQTAIPLDKPAVTDHPLGGLSTVLVDVDSWNLYFSRFTDVFEQKREEVEASLAKDYLAVARRVIVKLDAVVVQGSAGGAGPTAMPPQDRELVLRRVMALALDYGAIEVAKVTWDEIRIQFTVGRSALLFCAFLATVTRRELFGFDDGNGNGMVHSFLLSALPNKSHPQPTSLILGKRIMLPTKYMDALFVQMFDATSTDYRRAEGDFLITFSSHEAARLALHALQRSFLSTFGLLLTYKLDDPGDEPPLLLLLEQEGATSGSLVKPT